MSNSLTPEQLLELHDLLDCWNNIIFATNTAGVFSNSPNYPTSQVYEAFHKLINYASNCREEQKKRVEDFELNSTRTINHTYGNSQMALLVSFQILKTLKEQTRFCKCCDSVNAKTYLRDILLALAKEFDTCL